MGVAGESTGVLRSKALMESREGSGFFGGQKSAVGGFVLAGPEMSRSGASADSLLRRLRRLIAF